MTSNTTDVMNTARFADWCEQQVDREYDYLDPGSCALFQYLTSEGEPVLAVGGDHWEDTDGKCHELSGEIVKALWPRPRTFSALAKRLREVS